MKQICTPEIEIKEVKNVCFQFSRHQQSHTVPRSSSIRTDISKIKSINPTYKYPFLILQLLKFRCLIVGAHQSLNVRRTASRNARWTFNNHLECLKKLPKRLKDSWAGWERHGFGLSIVGKCCDRMANLKSVPPPSSRRINNNYNYP